jgi:hypothetical protein
VRSTADAFLERELCRVLGEVESGQLARLDAAAYLSKEAGCLSGDGASPFAVGSIMGWAMRLASGDDLNVPSPERDAMIAHLRGR